ncbi:MAG: polar amino acid transport system permease protein [Cocleimonas sp.]|jgi:polar amino acid transport system permease protein
MEFLSNYFNFRIVGQYTDVFIDGILATLVLAGICLVLSIFFGIFVALMRMSSNPLVWRTAAAYIQVIRATPLLIQIYLIYYGLPLLIGNFFGEEATAVIALTVHSTPYMAEIIRAGIASIDRGQSEGAMSVGMNKVQNMFYIVLPQALANVIPPMLGQTAVLIKDTSLFSIIAVFELMGAGLRMYSETVIATESYVTTAVCYLMIYMMMLIFSNIIQKKLGGGAWQTAH